MMSESEYREFRSFFDYVSGCLKFNEEQKEGGKEIHYDIFYKLVKEKFEETKENTTKQKNN